MYIYTKSALYTKTKSVLIIPRLIGWSLFVPRKNNKVTNI